MLWKKLKRPRLKYISFNFFQINEVNGDVRVRDIGALVLVINPESAESINLPQIRELLQSPNRSGSFRVIDKRRKVVRSDSGETGESNERVVEDTVVAGKTI